MSRFQRILRHWLPLAVLAFAFAGLSYLLAQQMLRQGANDPQVQIAQDTAETMGNAAVASTLIPAGVDIASSLSPFVQIYDDAGQIVAATAWLGDAVPIVPLGVLTSAQGTGENRITWQPREDVRIAAVVVRIPGENAGYVLAGRSLREVEARIDQLGQLVVLALVVTLVATLAVVILLEFVLAPRPPRA